MESKLRLVLLLLGIVTLFTGMSRSTWAETYYFTYYLSCDFSNIQSSQATPLYFVNYPGPNLSWGGTERFWGQNLYGLTIDDEGPHYPHFGPLIDTEHSANGLPSTGVQLMRGPGDYTYNPKTGIDSFDFEFRLTMESSWPDPPTPETDYPPPHLWDLRFQPFTINVHETAEMIWLEYPDDLPSLPFTVDGHTFTAQIVQGGIGEISVCFIPQSSVPEPSTILLIASGLVGLAGYGRKKFFKK